MPYFAVGQTISQVSVNAEAPVCFDTQCFVQFNFDGFEKLPAELLAEYASLSKCGVDDSFNPGNLDFTNIGQSRTMVAFINDRTIKERICNPNKLPNYGGKSMFPRYVLTYPITSIPHAVVVRIVDRKTGEKNVQRVRIPQLNNLVQDGSSCTDGNLTPYIPNVQFLAKNKQFSEKTLYTYCFNPGKSAGYLEVSIVNKGNTQCSDLNMKLISPTGEEFVSYGSQPGVTARQALGTWKIQFYLNWGCNMYDFAIRY